MYRTGLIIFIFFIFLIKNIGIQIGNTLFTLKHRIYRPFGYNIVIVREKPDKFILYKLTGKEIIKKHDVPIGHRLIHIVDNEHKTIVHNTNAPFEVTKGKLHLQKRKRKGYKFIYQTVHSKNSWPIHTDEYLKVNENDL